MQQISTIPFGSDATILAGYALAANDRLGNLDLVIENTGANDLYLKVAEYDGVTSPSGYADIGVPVTVVPKGTKTVSLSLLSKKIGFFGSGNTVANVSTVYRNRADLRGAQIDIVVQGRKGWGFDTAFDVNAFTSPGYGA
jgi:hypothetical protein